MRKALAILALLAAALWAAPALAQTTPEVDLAGWVKTNTDLAVSQVAIAGPENVYSLEPLGPALPTGEVLALVRTEAVNEGWRAAHRFLSWDAHMLFDCQAGRVRVLRSASYLERDRHGAAKTDESGDAWFAPERQTPAATLFAAACDPGFNWPLRSSSGTPPTTPADAASTAPTTVATATPPQKAQAAAARPIVLAKVEPAAAARTSANAASPDKAQFTSFTSAPSPSGLIQKASFTAPATLHSAMSPPKETFVAPGAPPRVSRAVAATRACKRIARASGGWLWRRVELALHGTAPSGALQAQAA